MKIDMHVHTRYSRDSRSGVAELIKRARKFLDGIAITDHNTMKGVQEARKLSKGFRIVAGEEVMTDRGEVMGYMLNEEIKSRNLMSVIDEIRCQGGLLSIPHPFDTIRSESLDGAALRKVLRKIDFIEVNGRSLPSHNKKAVEFASEHSIPLVGGSDAHFVGEVGKVYTIFDGGIRKGKTSVVGNPNLLRSLFFMGRTKMYKVLGV
jgi:predicted metal-dependent phosphoesterase TrpH